MTDYLNPHRIYTDRVDIPPGFDSVRPAVKESLTTAPAQIDRIKKLEKEVEQLTKYFERFARLNRLGLPGVEV